MQSDTLIVHQYSFSPFGQKVRSMLGFVDMAWGAVEVPPQPPRPSLDPMITGYRKSPVAQIGADLFCDTRTIAAEIARLSGHSELSMSDRNQTELEYRIAAGWATGMLTGKLAEVGAVLNLAFEVFAGFLAVDQDMPRLC